jgi:3-hydroxybutyryl-CoA dehydrogenase
VKRVAVLADRDAATGGLAERLASGGWTVAEWTAPAGDPDEPFDAAIDLCVADRARKEALLPRLEMALADGAPLLSSCHAAAATVSAALLRDPARLVGFALLEPIAERSTVECARGLQTAEPYASAAADLWRSAGFEPVWVGDCAGLVLPRIVACLANEAAFALMERVAAPEDIDRAMELGTRYPRGPLAWAEAIGLHRIVATLDALAAEQGDDRYRVASLLRHAAVARASWSSAGRRIAAATAT